MRSFQTYKISLPKLKKSWGTTLKASSNEIREFELSNNDILTLDDPILLTKKKLKHCEGIEKVKELIVHLKKKKKKEFHSKQRKLNYLNMVG